MMILRDAAYGHTRFDQFRKSLDIAPNILTRRLASLVSAGLLEKRRYTDKPPRDDYVLTARGRDFLPILAAVGAWGARHFGDDGNGVGVSRMVNAESGEAVEPVVVDRRTGRPIAEMDTRLVMPD